MNLWARVITFGLAIGSAALAYTNYAEMRTSGLNTTVFVVLFAIMSLVWLRWAIFPPAPKERT